MKLLNLVTFLTVSLLIVSGCGSKPTPKKEAVVDKTLPVITLTQNGVKSDMTAIALEWEGISDQRVKGIYIYRVDLDKKEVDSDYYDTVNSRFPTHFLDTNVEPNKKYNYYFKTFSSQAEGLRSKVFVASSLPVIDSVTWIHSIQGMPRSAKILWRPHTNERVKSYIIQRRTLEENVWTDVVTVDGRLSAEFIDKELKDRFTYIYRIRCVTYDGLKSKPSEEVKVITKELPHDVQNITATTNLAKKIEIRWSPSDVKDFLVYKIYRAKNVDGTYEYIANINDNVYIDEINEDAKQYFYRVGVVDKDELESVSSNHSIQGTTLGKPMAPLLVEAQLLDSAIKISWGKSADARVKSYVVQKRYKKSMFKELTEDFEGIRDLEFIDSSIENAKTYYYKVFSVDENGIKSDASIEVMLETPALVQTDMQQ